MSSKTQSNVGFILSPFSLASILSLYRQAFHLHNIKRKEHCFKQSEMRISFIIFFFLRSSFIIWKLNLFLLIFLLISISLWIKLFLLILYLSKNSGIDVILCINDYLPEFPSSVVPYESQKQAQTILTIIWKVKITFLVQEVDYRTMRNFVKRFSISELILLLDARLVFLLLPAIN